MVFFQYEYDTMLSDGFPGFIVIGPRPDALCDHIHMKTATPRPTFSGNTANNREQSPLARNKKELIKQPCFP